MSSQSHLTLLALTMLLQYGQNISLAMTITPRVLPDSLGLLQTEEDPIVLHDLAE